MTSRCGSRRSRRRLTREGLFDAGRKRPLPAWPRTIGVATSLSGAVLQDIRQVLARRWPMVRVVVSACQVQGPGRAGEHRGRAATAGPLDGRRRPGAARTSVILARGGGSLEDLWAFNEEMVVRAVAAHPCPVVVGVGHETDVTLAEFAADVRAATPSVAAELAVPARADQEARLRVLGGRLIADAGRRAVADRVRPWTPSAAPSTAFRPGGLPRRGARAGRACCWTARRAPSTPGSQRSGPAWCAWTTGCRCWSRVVWRGPGRTCGRRAARPGRTEPVRDPRAGLCDRA